MFHCRRCRCRARWYVHLLIATTATIAAGHEESFTATVTWSDGRTDRPNPVLFWTSSNPLKAAPASLTGPQFNTVRGISAGDVTITVTEPGSGTFVTAAVTVSGALLPVFTLDRPLVSVRPQNVNIAQGDTVDLTAVALYPDGHEEEVTGSVVWAPSDPTTMINLDPTHPNRFQALRPTPNNAAITVTATNAFGSQGSAYVVIRPLHTSLAFTPANAVLVRGRTLDFTAMVTFATGGTGTVPGTIFVSSNQAVAVIDIDPRNPTRINRFRAISPGTTTITATTPLGTMGSTTLTVIESAVLERIVVSPANRTIRRGVLNLFGQTIQVPDTLQFTAAGFYSDGTTRDLTPIVAWDARDDVLGVVIASIMPLGGLATAGFSNGSAIIRARLPILNISGETTLNVADTASPALNSISVEPKDVHILLEARNRLP